MQCQGSTGFCIPNPTERNHSKIFLVLEEVISWEAISFNALKLYLPFAVGLRYLCYICVTDRKLSCWKPIYCKDLSSSLLQEKFNFKSAEIVLQSNLFYSGKFLLCSNNLFFSGFQNLKHVTWIKGKDVRCNEEENSVLWKRLTFCELNNLSQISLMLTKKNPSKNPLKIKKAYNLSLKHVWFRLSI